MQRCHGTIHTNRRSAASRKNKMMRTKVLTECALEAMDTMAAIFPGVSNAALLHTATVHGNYSIIRDEDIESIDERLSGFQNAMRSSGGVGSPIYSIYAPSEFTCVVGKLNVQSTLIKAMVHKACFGSLKDFDCPNLRRGGCADDAGAGRSRFLGTVCVDACDMLLQRLSPSPEKADQQPVDLQTIRDEPLAATEDRLRRLVRACCIGISDRINDDTGMSTLAALAAASPFNLFSTRFPAGLYDARDAQGAWLWALSVLDWVERCYTNFASLDKLFRTELFPDLHPRSNNDMWRNIAAVVEMRIVKLHEWRTSMHKVMHHASKEQPSRPREEVARQQASILEEAWNFLLSLLVDSMNRQLWALLPVASYLGTSFIRRHVVAMAKPQVKAQLPSDLRYLMGLSSPELLGSLMACSNTNGPTDRLRELRRQFVALGNLFVMHGLLEALVGATYEEERLNREVLARVCPLDVTNNALPMVRAMMEGAARTIVSIRRCARLIEEFASQDAAAAAQGSAHGYEGTMECAGKSVLVEYAMRRLNGAVFGVNLDLMERARNDLFLVVGHERGTHLIGELQRTHAYADDAQEREYRAVLRSIALLWAAWTAAVATPGTWLPAETLCNAFSEASDEARQHAEEKAAAAPWCNGHYEQRRATLGTRACMLVTTLAAYACLPGRPLPGASFLEDGARESLHLMESDTSSRVRRAIITEQQQQSPPRAHLAISHHSRPSVNILDSRFVTASQEHRRRIQEPLGHSEEDEERVPSSLSPSSSEEEEEEEEEEGSDAAFPVYPTVAPYYKTRHFQRVGTHTSVAWDDCMWMMLMQEEALPEAQRSTRFVEYEREFVMLKPFLLFGAVFASGMARTGVLYNDEANAEFLRSVVQQQQQPLSCSSECQQQAAAAASTLPARRTRRRL